MLQAVRDHCAPLTLFSLLVQLGIIHMLSVYNMCPLGSYRKVLVLQGQHAHGWASSARSFLSTGYLHWVGPNVTFTIHLSYSALHCKFFFAYTHIISTNAVQNT